MTERNDPVGDKYYKPLAEMERWSGYIFYLSALLSVITLFVDGGAWSDIFQILFVLSVIANLVIGFMIRLWLAPRAEENRRLDLLSNSFSVKLTHENAVGYFNNSETNPMRRLALSVMESSFFTKNISAEMLVWERSKVVVYFGIWLICILNRTSELSWIAVATQAVFSEEILAKWLRMEWLCMKCQAIHTRLRRLVTTARSFSNSSTHAQVLENLAEYEAAKARASIGLSEGIFAKRNPKLSAEWETIKASLGLAS